MASARWVVKVAMPHWRGAWLPSMATVRTWDVLRFGFTDLSSPRKTRESEGPATRGPGGLEAARSAASTKIAGGSRWGGASRVSAVARLPPNPLDPSWGRVWRARVATDQHRTDPPEWPGNSTLAEPGLWGYDRATPRETSRASCRAQPATTPRCTIDATRRGGTRLLP